MRRNYLRLLCCSMLGASLALVACGGSGSSSTSSGGSTQTTTSSNGNVNVMLSDDSAQDWATIGVKVLGISLTPQGGGSAVSVYQAAEASAPIVNLEQLDQIGEILGNATVPQGAYTGATLTVSANPSDILLVTSADPEAGFPEPAGATIPANQIEVQGANGGSSVSLNIKLQSPLMVSASGSNALDLEFDLDNPAFLVEHYAAGTSSPIWAVNFNGVVRHRPIANIAHFMLRDLFGSVTAVAADNSSLTISREFPTEPAASPETPVSTAQSLQINADSTNGTIFYDMDAKTKTVIKDFSTLAASIVGKQIRVNARYQPDGALVAVRIWASTSFNTVWFNPEGHVLSANASTGVLTVQNEDGQPQPVTIDSNTQFFFHDRGGKSPIGTGAAFLSNIVRGFKVEVNVVDPLANPLVAGTVNIEQAHFSGAISAASSAGFTYTRNFANSSDDYTITLGYIASSTANGTDASGNAISGYKWWYFTYPTQADTGANAVSDFVTVANGSANFGGTVPPQVVWGDSYAVWNDPANPNGWSVAWTVIQPTPLPKGTVSTPFAATSSGGTFAMTVSGGVNPVVIDLSAAANSATLVFQVDKSNGVVTISQQDITTSSGMSTVSAALAAGVPVKVYGVPQSDGSIRAYVLIYFTGTLPQ